MGEANTEESRTPRKNNGKSIIKKLNDSWRPAAGWICSLALLWWFFLRDIFQWVIFLKGIELKGSPSSDPLDSLLTVTLALLGLGGLRTYEKVKGVNTQ